MNILIVIDMQNDFIDGALGTPEAVSIVPKVAERIKTAQAQGWKIFFTRDTHDDAYLQTQEGQRLPVPHCVRGTQGWEISSRLDTQGAEIIDKPSFGSQALVQRLCALWPEPDRIELIGLCTDICVISNAFLLKTAFPESLLCVNADCCAGVTPESHKTALSAMRACQIEILTETIPA